MTASPLPVMLSPAEEETRVVLRALFSRLLMMEPGRYSPLYVGPLRRAEPVRRALEDAAAACGVGVVGAEALWEYAPPDAVGLAPLRAAPHILQAETPRRWIVVGDVDPDRLDGAFLDRIGEVGLIYDTRQVPAPPAGASSLASMLAECAARPGPWVLRVAADPDVAPVVAAEAAVRLRILGYAVGGVWEAGGDSRLPDLDFPPHGRSALVVRLDSGLPGEIAGALRERAHRAGAALVFVGSASVAASLALHLHPHPSAFVRASPDPVPEAVRRANWLPARAVLTGAPESGAQRDLISQVDAQCRALNHIVRAAASWERRGFLLVYTPDRFGWIAVDGRESLVRGAWRVGDGGGPPSADTILARIRAMSLWEGIRALFVAATDPLPAFADVSEILVDTVDLDVRRTLDEIRERRLPPGSLGPDVVPVCPSRVARELLWWGQQRPAHELLQDAERASAWGVDEELLLGYLSAERDPREAAARLQHAAHRLSDDLAGARWGQHVDATLSSLLLEVRAYPSQARHAWGVVERWIESQGEGWVESPRRAAVVFELAARAGEIAQAIRFRDLVLRLSHPGDVLPTWVASSDPLLELEVSA